MTAPYKNAGHAVADGLVVLVLTVASVWPAVRSGLRRPRRRRTALAAPVNLHSPDSPCAHARPKSAAVPSVETPRALTRAETKPGYCGFCGHNPCSCVRGDAA